MTCHLQVFGLKPEMTLIQIFQPVAARVQKDRTILPQEGRFHRQQRAIFLVSMSIRLLANVWDTPMNSPVNKLVLLAIADNANDQGQCFPSIKTIETKCDLSRRAVFEAISALKTMGFLQVRSGGGRFSNTYIISPSLCENPRKDDRCAKCTAPVQEAHPTSAPSAPITNIEPSVQPVPLQSPSRGRRQVVQISDRAKAVGLAFWQEFPAMKPLGEKRITQNLVELDALLQCMSDTELRNMVLGLKNDQFRHGWVSSFLAITENLPKIRAYLGTKQNGNTNGHSYLTEFRANGGR